MNSILELESGEQVKVPPPHLAEVVRSAEQQLVELLDRRTEIMRRISNLKQLLAGMANIFGDSILNEELLIALDRGPSSRRRGFTKACRQVLMDSRAPLRARHAGEVMQQRFPDVVSHHKDLIASITTVFHRLEEYGEARCSVDEQGVKVWQWATSSENVEETAALLSVVAASDARAISAD